MRTRSYLAYRFLSIIPVLLVLSFVIFGIIEAIPGDPAQIMLGQHATPEALEQMRHSLGLDRPWTVRYVLFLGRLTRGDLGKSILSGRSVLSEIAEKVPATLELSLVALLLAGVLGVLAGFLSAWRQNSLFDYFAMFGSLVGVSIPIYWLGFMLIILFSLNLGWLPTGGRLAATIEFQPLTNFYLLDALLSGNREVLADAIRHLVMPAFCLATVPMAIIARMTRSSMLEVLNQDYIRTARAKGVRTGRLLFLHAFKNASIPVVTVIGLQFGYLMGGAILTETVFSWPGIGRWLLDGILGRDFPVIAGGTLFVAAAFIMVNLLVDLLYLFLDPRIRY